MPVENHSTWVKTNPATVNGETMGNMCGMISSKYKHANTIIWMFIGRTNHPRLLSLNKYIYICVCARIIFLRHPSIFICRCSCFFVASRSDDPDDLWNGCYWMEWHFYIHSKKNCSHAFLKMCSLSHVLIADICWPSTKFHQIIGKTA